MMKTRHFRTAIFGGFRKKDVVDFLAEERRKQDEELESLRETAGALEDSVNVLQGEKESLQDALRRKELSENDSAVRLEELKMQLVREKQRADDLEAGSAALWKRIAALEARLSGGGAPPAEEAPPEPAPPAEEPGRLSRPARPEDRQPQGAPEPASPKLAHSAMPRTPLQPEPSRAASPGKSAIQRLLELARKKGS